MNQSQRESRPADETGKTPAGDVPSFDADLVIADDPQAIRDSGNEFITAAERCGYPEAARFALRVAFEEAVINALRHGQPPEGGAPAKVQWSVTPSRISITVEDEGPGFNPDDVPDPTAPDRLEIPSGRGIMLIKAYMTRVEYNDRGNRVTMIYEPGVHEQG